LKLYHPIKIVIGVLFNSVCEKSASNALLSSILCLEVSSKYALNLSINAVFSAVAADIMRQSGGNKYVVRTAQGVGRVKLVAATPVKGEARIIATDSAGGTYYVTELRGRKAHIIKGDQTGTQFTTGTAGIDVPWTFNETSGTKVYDSQPYLAAGVNVKIANA
jgi:hypothetical protein